MNTRHLTGIYQVPRISRTWFGLLLPKRVVYQGSGLHTADSLTHCAHWELSTSQAINYVKIPPDPRPPRWSCLAGTCGDPAWKRAASRRRCGTSWRLGPTLPFPARMAAAGCGAGLGTSTGLEAATLQKLALRRKKVLGTEEMELYELAQAAGATIDPDVFKILVDLLNLNVAPLAVFQILKSMCAGQRLASDSQDSVSTSLSTSETRGRNRGGPTLGSVPIVAERGSREGPIQRMPRQPSATRLPKVAGPGKSNSRSST